MNRKWFLVLSSCMVFIMTGFAFAADEVVHAKDPYSSLAAALGIAIAAFGGALGQAKTAVAALEGIGRNPSCRDKIFVPMIIGLALIESLVLYAFIITVKL